MRLGLVLGSAAAAGFLDGICVVGGWVSVVCVRAAVGREHRSAECGERAWGCTHATVVIRKPWKREGKQTCQPPRMKLMLKTTKNVTHTHHPHHHQTHRRTQPISSFLPHPPRVCVVHMSARPPRRQVRSQHGGSAPSARCSGPVGVPPSSSTIIIITSTGPPPAVC